VATPVPKANANNKKLASVKNVTEISADVNINQK
jgi:hypothetical protein